MGGSTSRAARLVHFTADGGRIKKVFEELKSHSNYSLPNPKTYTSLIEYTLACAAMLVSPPQEEGESNDIECVDLAKAIILLEPEIKKAWINKTMESI